MSYYDHLPIYKSSIDFCRYIELIVKTFDRYNKYAIGSDLRDLAKKILFSISRINDQRDKSDSLYKFIYLCEDTKALLQVAKELNVFKSFNQFEHSTKLLINICKQAQSWYNSVARISK